MAQFLGGCISGLIVGLFIGAFLVTRFDVVNQSYLIKRLRAKKGGVIDINQDIAQPEPEVKEKDNIFTRIQTKIKHRRKNK